MLTKRELIERGFTEYKPAAFENADRCYQKCYYDGNIRKYFLDAKHYSLTHPATGEDFSNYELSTQLYTKGNHNALNITFLNDNIDEAEALIECLFEGGKVEPYDFRD